MESLLLHTGFLKLWCAGFSLQWLPLLQNTDFRMSWLPQLQRTSLVALWHVGF